MTVIYDVLLKQQDYEPVIGYIGEPKYTCIFYDEDRRKALKEMQKYRKKNGFVTPDGQYSVTDIVLREREGTGEVLSITPYHKLFDPVTWILVDQNLTVRIKEKVPAGAATPDAGTQEIHQEQNTGKTTSGQVARCQKCGEHMEWTGKVWLTCPHCGQLQSWPTEVCRK